MTQRIRVLIVDDQTLVREGFRKLLEMEPDFEVIGTGRRWGKRDLYCRAPVRPRDTTRCHSHYIRRR